MSDLLYSIKEIFSDKEYLEEEGKEYYNIPLYQRGYKWTPHNVEKLLIDIDNFKQDGDKFYCLQNITLVPNNNVFNVVDGQQRLTTLTILLSFLEENKLVYNKVRFPENSIRKETNNFLNNIITNKEVSFPEASWDEFIIENEEYDHQDIYHIFIVYKAIENWFEKKKEKPHFSKSEYKDKLLKHVKFIVNKIDDTTSEEKVFGNLNSKRIPLDGADLVRAILITRVAHEEGKQEGDIKNIVRVNERRIKIGWYLDQINNWWYRPDVNSYFRKFVNISSEEIGAGVKLFNENKYPINLLYLLFAEKRSEKILSLELIENSNNNALGLYKELIKLNDTLNDWFQDRQIYHLLGYLFSFKEKRDFNFSILWKIWDDSKNRDNFIRELKSLIKETLTVDSELIDFSDTKTNWYNSEPKKLVQALVLMDIIHSQNETQAFLPFYAFTKQTNDIEHIFPQTPEDVEKKKEYIEFLNKHYIDNEADKFDLTDFGNKLEYEDYKENLDAFINKIIEGFKINSIGNLVLLYSSLNRSISNNPYAVKRTRVIEYFNQGNFIQPHTFKVFVRYFNNEKKENNDFEHWTNNDIEANAQNIYKTISEFLK